MPILLWNIELLAEFKLSPDRPWRCNWRLRHLRVRLHPWENGVGAGRVCAGRAVHQPDLHAFLLKLTAQSWLWIFLCASPPAGIVQIPGPSRVGPGHAHHHLWRNQARSRDAVSQLAEVTGEMMRNLRSFHLNFLCSFILFSPWNTGLGGQFFLHKGWRRVWTLRPRPALLKSRVWGRTLLLWI